MVDSKFYAMVDHIVKGDARFYVVMYRLWQFDDLGGMLYGTILNSTNSILVYFFHVFPNRWIHLIFHACFLTSLFPLCAPGTAIWPEFAKKTSRSFFIPVILLHLSGYSVLHFLINFCYFCPTSQSSLPAVTTTSHHHITIPHHGTARHCPI